MKQNQSSKPFATDENPTQDTLSLLEKMLQRNGGAHMGKLLLQDLSITNKKVLMRVDFNVPLNPDGTISDDTRIKATLPSIEYVLEKGGSLILLSHLGRPDGKKNPKYSLKPCAERLEELLGKKVTFVSDCIGKEVEEKVAALLPEEVLLLENLRFYPEEENPALNPSFAKQIASFGDCYVNDGFSVSHRSHSSVTEIPKYFFDKSAAGFLLEKELHYLTLITTHPKTPFYALLSGSKISTKMGLVEKLLDKVDALFIGGGMAYTLFKTQGRAIGDSICEEAFLETAHNLLNKCAHLKIPIHLPKDIVAAQGFSNEAPQKIFPIDEGIPSGWQGMDIGPMTCKAWEEALKPAKTVFWNGPFGVYEFPNFSHGTLAIAKTIGALKALKIVGGGDSVAAIEKFQLAEQFTHLSTGGGASIEFIEKNSLPGIDALTNKEQSL